MKYNYNELLKCYQNGIVNKMVQNGHIFQRIITPMYRSITSNTHCEGFDKYGEVSYQVSTDDGVTWVTTASTEGLIEKNSIDCGYTGPYIKCTNASSTNFSTRSDADGNLSHIQSAAYNQTQLMSRCVIQVKGITSITFKITQSVDSSGLRFYSSKDNYQTGTTVKIVGRTWTLGDLDPSLTYGIQVQLIRRDAQYITGTNCGADITYTTP